MHGTGGVAAVDTLPAATSAPKVNPIMNPFIAIDVAINHKKLSKQLAAIDGTPMIYNYAGTIMKSQM